MVWVKIGRSSQKAISGGVLCSKVDVSFSPRTDPCSVCLLWRRNTATRLDSTICWWVRAISHTSALESRLTSAVTDACVDTTVSHADWLVMYGQHSNSNSPLANSADSQSKDLIWETIVTCLPNASFHLAAPLWLGQPMHFFINADSICPTYCSQTYLWTVHENDL